MLIQHPWDYQELSNLLQFADGTVPESETKLGYFHFLTLKNSNLCPDPWYLLLELGFLCCPMMKRYKKNSFKPWKLVTAALQALKVDRNFIFWRFWELTATCVIMVTLIFFKKFSSPHFVLSVYQKHSCDLNGTWEKKSSKLQN